MKRITLIILSLFSALMVVKAQDCFRFTYLLQQKRDVNELTFHTSEMKLDYDGKSAFFYNEISFLKDSLDVYAFDKAGDIANEDAYAQRSRLPGNAINDKSWIDFKNRSFTQYYFDLTTFYGTMPMELPQWGLTDKVEDKSGYSCKIANGTFLGREWTIWYTEEVPINVGPWFLWGAPGLIVNAKDSEDLVEFMLVSVESIDYSRLDKDNSYRKVRESKPKARVYSLSMKEMETMFTKYKRDMDYFSKINGVINIYSKNRDGSLSKEIGRPYIPLIPDEYWQKK